jgi:hypothetical protein
MLSQIDRNVKKVGLQAPELVDTLAQGKVARAIRTATYSDKKDFKLVENSTAFTMK